MTTYSLFNFSADAMADWLILWTLRTATLLLAGLLVLRWLRSKPASVQHTWLLSLLAIPLMLPVLDLAANALRPQLPELPISWAPSQVITSWDLGPNTPYIPGAQPNQPEFAITPTFSLPWTACLCLIWGIGIACVLTRMVLSLLHLRHLEQRATVISSGPLHLALEQERERQQVCGPVRLLLASGYLPPMTWGLRRCRIILPAEAATWEAAHLETVLRHELAHVRRRDGRLLLVGQTVLALQWWNPLMWLTLRHLRETTEFLCDDFVLRSGSPAPDYAETLLRSASRRMPVLPSALSNAHGLAGRVTRILDSRIDRRTTRTRLPLILLGGLLLAAWPLTQLSGKTEDGVMKVDGYLVPIRIADGFDYPVGAPDGKDYYLFRKAAFSSGHMGDDWNGASGGNNDLGDPVYAIADGLVIDSTDYRAGWGNVIIVRHRYRDLDGKIKVVDSLYAHLHARKVKEGDLVRRGQEIGSIGNNRGMYYAHLHMELRQNLDIKVTNRSEFERNSKNWLLPNRFIRERRP